LTTIVFPKNSGLKIGAMSLGRLSQAWSGMNGISRYGGVGG
jgi:hypothetical protein